MDGTVLDFFQNLVGNLGDAIDGTKCSVRPDDGHQVRSPSAENNATDVVTLSSPVECKTSRSSRHSVKAKRGSGMWVPKPKEGEAENDLIDTTEDDVISIDFDPAVDDLLASVDSVPSASSPTPESSLAASAAAAGSSRSKQKAKYVPPKGKYSSPDGSESPRRSSGSSDQERFKQWLKWDKEELEKRKRALIGKSIVGKLSPKRGNRYFIKWNINDNDTVVISSDCVEDVLGSTPPAGMWVSATIIGLGPTHVQWNKQHPYAMTLESRETRPSHQPKKGLMPRNSPYWKKNQKAGLTRAVSVDPTLYHTVPAEVNMARYSSSSSRSPRAKPSTSPPAMRSTYPLPEHSPPAFLPPKPPSRQRSSGSSNATGVLTAEDVIAEMRAQEAASKQAGKPKIHDLKATQGANVNLVTGEVRAMGRSDKFNNWRSIRDRSFTV
jgi:hypothetical protein